MNLPKVIASAKKEKYSVINEEELNYFLTKSIILIEKDTLISDKIRLLKLKEEFILQEKSAKDEYLIRIMKSIKDGEDFIKQRFEIYDRMWDGCGCRVNYYE